MADKKNTSLAPSNQGGFALTPSAAKARVEDTYGTRTASALGPFAAGGAYLGTAAGGPVGGVAGAAAGALLSFGFMLFSDDK